ncbi:MAG: hypothetical protein LBG28_02570 [Tannerella sp.]|jgi:hypothetical protein|nr:hypothetical protein [Tannerella sp.]
MRLTNDFKLTILGVGALALMLGLNIRHALNNYGITDGNLHMEILAQSNSSGGGSGSGGLGTDYVKHDRECGITVTGQAGIPLIIRGVSFVIPVGGTLTVSFSNAAVDCEGGGNFMCQYMSCSDFWQSVSCGGSSSN